MAIGIIVLIVAYLIIGSTIIYSWISYAEFPNSEYYHTLKVQIMEISNYDAKIVMGESKSTPIKYLNLKELDELRLVRLITFLENSQVKIRFIEYQNFIPNELKARLNNLETLT